MRRLFSIGALVPLLVACTAYSTLQNRPVEDKALTSDYSLHRVVHNPRSSDVTLVLAFSGGGTRAAALAYGVLQELRDTEVVLSGQPRRLLDEVDVISSVSGGSFTAAYFGLYGDGVFEDFERKFLRRDVATELVSALVSPFFWFSRQGRSDLAADLYERSVFQGATFADLQRRDGPLIIINATDLGSGVRFSFLQDYFDLLCSDLSSYPVARAVTASSAVPMLFSPVVLENHAGCDSNAKRALQVARQRPGNSPQLKQLVSGLSSYARKDERKFIHLVDGGITDNLGLLAFQETIDVAGGARAFLEHVGGSAAPRLAVISVNASTNSGAAIDASSFSPTLEQTVNAVTDIQLHRSNNATVELFGRSMKRWAAELSTDDHPVESYFVQVELQAVTEPVQRALLQTIPTTLSLDSLQVDSLIAAGRQLLRENSEFVRFRRDLATHK
ncbi:patatin-like phospholipase family protein [Rhodoferax sp. PAMC 29310]|uniref:patatin-like phospholipase family protein n=1 Tax=Rhodoferax sp. PAMC 29310 TaxID=2822760 RepID=UPI001B31CECB|nr:patatin-like phospholipase family protein [Rhodoferax sp. PAMC 29310]